MSQDSHPHDLCMLSCRFDVRALLDFYKEPDPRVLAARQQSHEERKLEEVDTTLAGCSAVYAPAR